MVELEQEEFAILATCAIRYCQGRQTYMPSLVQSICRNHIAEFTDRDLKAMIDDCDYQDRFNLYGDEHVDKPGWLKWKEDLNNELLQRHEASL